MFDNDLFELEDKIKILLADKKRKKTSNVLGVIKDL